MPVEDQIAALRRLAGASSDRELAERIGVSKQTISAWRRRGAIPHKAEMALGELFGPDVVGSSFARHVFTTRERRILQAVFLRLYDDRRQQGSAPENSSSRLRWANLFAEVESELREKLREYGFIEETRAGAVSFREEQAVVAFLLALIEAGKIDSYNDAALILANDNDENPRAGA
jgi:hypothetical protein